MIITELKNEDKGIISWSTRGHNIKATTGFQAKGYNNVELMKYFKHILNSNDKTFTLLLPHQLIYLNQKQN